MGFSVQKLRIPELLLFTPEIRRDDRGFFVEIYKATDFAAQGLKKNFRQVNHSRSQKDVIRGLHYQLEPAAQGKLLRVVVGEIFDVAVDIRDGSPTFGRWAGVTLKAADEQLLYIPEGFAHGFCALTDSAELEYFSTAEYSPAHERGILWNDPAVGIRWPVTNPILSKKDSQLPPLKAAEKNFSYART